MVEYFAASLCRWEGGGGGERDCSSPLAREREGAGRCMSFAESTTTVECGGWRGWRDRSEESVFL